MQSVHMQLSRSNFMKIDDDEPRTFYQWRTTTTTATKRLSACMPGSVVSIENASVRKLQPRLERAWYYGKDYNGTCPFRHMLCTLTEVQEVSLAPGALHPQPHMLVVVRALESLWSCRDDTDQFYLFWFPLFVWTSQYSLLSWEQSESWLKFSSE